MITSFHHCSSCELLVVTDHLCCTCLLFVQVKRRTSFYIVVLILPCVLLSCLTLVMFWFPPQRPDRTGLGNHICSHTLTHIPSYTYPHTHTLTHTLTHTHPHTHTPLRTHPHTHIPSHTYPHTYTLTHIPSHTHPHTHTLTHIPSHTYLHTHPYTHTPLHTYPHTHIPSPQHTISHHNVLAGQAYMHIPSHKAFITLTHLPSSQHPDRRGVSNHVTLSITGQHYTSIVHVVHLHIHCIKSAHIYSSHLYTTLSTFTSLFSVIHMIVMLWIVCYRWVIALSVIYCIIISYLSIAIYVLYAYNQKSV